MVDIVRALHSGTAPTVASVFKDVPLLKRWSISYIRTVFIGELQPLPATNSSDESFLILLVILHELTIYSSLHRTVHIRFGQPGNEEAGVLPLQPDEDQFVPFSHANEMLRARKSLLRILDAWGQSYTSINGPERLALYYFCRLYLTFPELHFLPTAAGCQSVGVGRSYAHANPVQFYNMNENTITNSSHYAWLVLENVSRRKGFLPSWCPIITFYGALVVWMCIHVQEKFERPRSSRMVLRLFKAELDKMTWLCCADMAEHLEKLASE